ncbi:MAG: Ig-like domain-containing protein, partial [Candidatus Falkowbacteria bacterium]|nr:Ig-like domain-containing protein [Candidatus Falkowbacteria bacterium]
YIRAALVLNSAINVTPATDKVINIESRAPGVAGNNLVISTSNNSALPITAMHNGANAVMSIDPATLPKDQPKNAIIQLTFNEAINPINLIGTSNQVQDTIRVIDSTHANVIVTGNFNISNLYKTIAFTPNNPCGVNACGQSIYCLPADANLKIELVAASLDTCARNEDCVSKNPYAICSTSKHCQKPAPDSTNYPMASTTSNTGIIDAAMNSLDGNRDSKAQGPISYFNENIKPADRTLADAAKGDSFQWSFWTSDQLDISSPTITGQSVSQGSSILDANLANSITLEFSKVMESNSLSTGITELTIGGKKITHKKINLNNLNNQPVGYWITSAGADETSQPDTYPEKTNAFLNHTPFLTANSFKASVGSGVRDIYQNCFKPCQGPAETCTGLSDTKPSWCSGTAQASDTCPK